MKTTELDGLEKKHLEKIEAMVSWRLRPDASGHQHSEASALVWALDCLSDYFGLDEDH